MSERIVYVAQKGSAIKWEVPRRELAPNEVRVKIHSTGINPIDWKTIDNNMADGAGQGNDFAGTVVEVGSDVKHTKVGDTVAGGVAGGNVDDKEQGAFSTDIKIDENLLFRFPQSLEAAKSDDIDVGVPKTFEQAASLGIAAVTTALAFEKQNKPQPGDYALIYGATSSLGFFAAQFARNLGYKVIAVSARSPVLENQGFEFIDRHDKDWVEQAKRIANNNISFAFDTIVLDDSTKSVLHTLRSEGPAILAMSNPSLQIDNVPKHVEVVRLMYFFAYQSTKKFGTAAFPDKTNTVNRAPQLIQELNKQFAEQKIDALPIKVLHGLHKVNDGLGLNRQGVRGTKIVVDVN